MKNIIPKKYEKYNLIPNHVNNNKDIIVDEKPDKNNWCVLQYIAPNTESLTNGNYYFFIPTKEGSLYMIDDSEKVSVSYTYPVSLFELVEDPEGLLSEIWKEGKEGRERIKKYIAD